MARRLITLAIVAAVIVSLSPLASFAGDTKSAATTKTSASSTTTKTKSSSTPSTHSSSMAVNEIAVCGCGKVFTPTASTSYLSFGGKKYACCSEECHKMAEGNPAAAAKMADDNTAKVMAQLASNTAPASSTPASSAPKTN